MRRQLINTALLFFTMLYGACAMPFEFICAHEKDTSPGFDEQADQWFKQARQLSKERIPDWGQVAYLYQQAVDKDHWKAMHNLAELYLRGKGVEKNTNKAINLYERMVELNVALGYYDMSVMVGRGVGVVQSDRESILFLLKAADLGNPQAQVRLGNIYIYDKKDRTEGVRYLRCAAMQNYGPANIEMGMYYEVSDRNYPVAMHYYQRAAALGEGKGFLAIIDTFKYGELEYKKNETLAEDYQSALRKLRENPDTRFPNLAKDYPLPPHPIQGYHADKDINWKPTGRDDDY